MQYITFKKPMFVSYFNHINLSKSGCYDFDVESEINDDSFFKQLFLNFAKSNATNHGKDFNNSTSETFVCSVSAIMDVEL